VKVAPFLADVAEWQERQFARRHVLNRMKASALSRLKQHVTVASIAPLGGPVRAGVVDEPAQFLSGRRPRRGHPTSRMGGFR